MSDNSRIVNEFKWYALRDLKRANAKQRAWEVLADKGFEVFTPLHWKLISKRGGEKNRIKVPVIPDLLFVKSTRSQLDPEVNGCPTLQYRFIKNGRGAVMTVRQDEMDRFRNAVSEIDKVRFYTPEEIGKDKVGKHVTIVGGPLNGYEGKLLTVRGSKIKRLIVSLQNYVCAGVEVNPEYIRIIENEVK